MKLNCPALSLILIGLIVFPEVQAQEWARFRGPNGSGVADVKNLPTTFDATTTAWKIETGRGWSSPVVWKGKVFLTAETGSGKRAVVCLSAADGKSLWTYEVPYQEHRQHKFNAFASSTPFVDEQRIYVNWTNGDAVEALALDHTGKLLWRRENLAPYVHEHGSGVSAVVADGIMIVRCESDPTEGDVPVKGAKSVSNVQGLDIATGVTRWTLPLPSSKNPYSTPVVRKTAAGSEAIMANSSSGFFGVDVKSGKITWQHNPGYSQRSVGSFALAGDLLFGTLGSGGGGKESAALKLGGSQPKEIYKLIMGISYVPTPLVLGDLLFLLGDGGIMKCVKMQTGEEIYNERVSGSKGNSTKYFSSPVAGDGKIYCCSQTGDVVVLMAGGKFEVLAANKLDSPIYATPALAEGRIYIRTEKMLWALGAKGQRVP